MESRYILGSAILLSASCAPKFYTPSSSAQFWANEGSPTRQIVLPDYTYVAASWQLPPESPWAAYAKPTLLAALQEMGKRPVAPLPPSEADPNVDLDSQPPPAPTETPPPDDPQFVQPPPSDPPPDAGDAPVAGATPTPSVSDPPPLAPPPLAPPPLAPPPPPPAPITLPDVSTMPVVQSAIAAAIHVANSGVPDDAMWMVDLRGAASVAFGSTLSQRTALPMAVVPTFNNWPGDDEVIPAEDTLAAMVTMPPRKPTAEEVSARPIFLLDAWRLAFRNDTIDEEAYDNRYYLNPADLPSVERLQQQGIQRLIYVVEDLNAVTNEEDDLHETLMAYQEAGIAIHFVDLAWLSGYVPMSTFVETWRPRRYTLIHRRTILHDHHFFLRGRGGFGGHHATPGWGRHAYTPTHHYHYHGWYRGGG